MSISGQMMPKANSARTKKLRHFSYIGFGAGFVMLVVFGVTKAVLLYMTELSSYGIFLAAMSAALSLLCPAFALWLYSIKLATDRRTQ
jgi:hypothetical protein